VELAALWWQAWSALALALALSAPPYEHLQELHALCSERRRRGGPVRRRRRSSALLVWPCNTTAPLHLLKPSMATSRPLAFFSSRVAGGTHAGDPQRDPAHMSNTESAAGHPPSWGSSTTPPGGTTLTRSHPGVGSSGGALSSVEPCPTVGSRLGFTLQTPPRFEVSPSKVRARSMSPWLPSPFRIPRPHAQHQGDAKIGCQRPKEVGMKRPSMDRSSIRRDATQPLTYRR